MARKSCQSRSGASASPSSPTQASFVFSVRSSPQMNQSIPKNPSITLAATSGLQDVSHPTRAGPLRIARRPTPRTTGRESCGITRSSPLLRVRLTSRDATPDFGLPHTGVFLAVWRSTARRDGFRFARTRLLRPTAPLRLSPEGDATSPGVSPLPPLLPVRTPHVSRGCVFRRVVSQPARHFPQPADRFTLAFFHAIVTGWRLPSASTRSRLAAGTLAATCCPKESG